MKVYKTVEFDEDDVSVVTKMIYLARRIEKYDLMDEFNLCSWNAFTGNLDKLQNYMKGHQEKEK